MTERSMFFRAAVLGFALHLLAYPAEAQQVSLTPTNVGVTAGYQVDTQATSVAFADPSIIRADWRSGSRGATLNKTGVSLLTTTDRFSLMVRPDSTEDGRGYISLTKLGDGFVLFAPSLALEGQTLALKFNLPNGWTAVPQNRFDGYVYIGPRIAVTETPSGVSHIATTDAAEKAMVATLFQAFDTAHDFFAELFGPVVAEPVIAITLEGAGPTPFRGDVTDSGMISIRLDRALAQNTDPGMLAESAHFAFHEASHLWNSHLAVPSEGSPWLHEGGAEYLALMAQVTTGAIDEARGRALLSERLNDCRANLGSRPDAEAHINANSGTYYSCGTVIQWLADMELRRAGGDGVVNVWARFIDSARRGSPGYQPADFRAMLGPRSMALSLLDTPANARWVDLDAALTAFGVRWENSPSASVLLTATLRHVKAQACSGGTSFSLRDAFIELDNGDNCGPLSGVFELGTIEGHDPLSATSEMFEAVQARCAAGNAVRVTRRGSTESGMVPCLVELPTPVAYDLTEIPAIALSRNTEHR